MKKRIESSFDIVGFIKADNGDFTSMVTDEGFRLEFRDKDNNLIPLNRDAVEKFIKNEAT